jgi:CDP-diglyceride synthetase
MKFSITDLMMYSDKEAGLVIVLFSIFISVYMVLEIYNKTKTAKHNLEMPQLMILNILLYLVGNVLFCTYYWLFDTFYLAIGFVQLFILGVEKKIVSSMIEQFLKIEKTECSYLDIVNATLEAHEASIVNLQLTDNKHMVGTTSKTKYIFDDEGKYKVMEAGDAS